MASVRIRAFFALVLLLAGPALAEKQPADARLLDVTRPEFGAIPNDGLDDYAAVKIAIGVYDGFNGNTLYFPCGTYDFSDTIEWRDYSGPKVGTPPNDVYPWTVGAPIMGEDRDCVVLKLADNAVGFGDPNTPKSFIKMGSLVGPSSNLKGASGDSGAGAYQNSIEDVTIDCGSGNPGVRCLDWIASNAGELRRVKVLTHDGQGLAGIYLGRAWPGPALVMDADVSGFNYGIQLGQIQYSVTFFRNHLHGQHVAGFTYSDNMASIDKLTVDETEDIPAITNTGTSGQLELVRSTLNGPEGATHSAIEVLDGTKSKYYIEKLTTTGYPSVIKKGTVVSDVGPNLDLAIGPITTPFKLYNAPDAPVAIDPADDPPDPYWVSPDDHPELWANVLSYGAGNGIGGELTADQVGIQAAMNSGRPIVYFPKLVSRPSAPIQGADGIYALRAPILVPGTVRRVIFNRNTMDVRKTAYPTANDCVFAVIGTADDPPVEFNYFRRGGDDIAPARHFCNLSSGRTMIIRSSPSSLHYRFDSGINYVIDTISDWVVTGGAKVYGWQHDQERSPGSSFSAGTELEGADSLVRTVGMKSEGDFTMARVTGGARYKVVGGFYFPCIGINIPNSVQSDAFQFVDSTGSLSFLQYCGKNPSSQGYAYNKEISQTIGETTRSLFSTQTINALSCCSIRNYTPYFNASPSDLVITPLQLGFGPPTTYLPFGLSGNSYKMVQVDLSGVNGVNMDPGQWTQPANCSGMSHLTAQIQRTGDGLSDVDLYSCLQVPGGPLIGLFDPKGGTTPRDQRSCVNLTRDVVLDGTPPNDQFEFEGSVGQIVARLNRCDGDCATLVTVQCTR